MGNLFHKQQQNVEPIKNADVNVSEGQDMTITAPGAGLYKQYNGINNFGSLKVSGDGGGQADIRGVMNTGFMQIGGLILLI